MRIKKIKKRKTAIPVALFVFLAATVSLLTFLTVRASFSNTLAEIEETLKEKEGKIESYQSFLPIRNWDVDYPNLSAGGFLLAFSDSNGQTKILFEKNINHKLPIASITKLMTALVAIEEYGINERIIISEEAFLTGSNMIYPGETYKVIDLIHAALIESNNAAAQALAEKRTLFDYNKSDAPFIAKMNQKARSLGMENTYFINATGLDPIEPHQTIGYSTPNDLLIFAKHLLFEAPLLWEISMMENYDLRTADGSFKYTAQKTNHLIDEMTELVGGKTGQTSRARGCLLSVFEKPEKDGYLISIILGSSDRFEETKALVSLAEEGYYWEI